MFLKGERQVTSPLMECALDRAIERGHNVLYELVRRESTLPGEWEYLSKFRNCDTQPLPDNEAVVQSLRRRLLVEEDGCPMADERAADVPMASEAGIGY
jgi:hypothetical protein